MMKFEEEAKKIYDELKEFTIIPEKRFVENLCYANWLNYQQDFPNGSIVECGVWRGGMSAGFLQIFGSERSYLLFDSFAGLPEPSPNDGEDARWWFKNPDHPRNFNNCTAPKSYVKKLFDNEISKGTDVLIAEGWFAETLPKISIKPIAFLHLDCDWYDSNYTCLQRLWPHILPGGAIIIDDYFDWEGCRRSLHDFLSANRARESIERVGLTGGALIRRRGPWDISESPHLM